MASSELNLFLGIFLSIIGAIINGAGYIIQKLAHRKIQQRPKEQQKHFAKDGMWWFGFLVYAVGSLLQAAALAFAAQSLLTPMASLTLVANAWMAPRFLGEKIHRKDIYATAIIVIGTVVTVVFGPHDDTEFDTEELWQLYIETPFVVFSSILGGASVVDYVFVKLTQRKNKLAGRVLTGDLSEPTAKFLALSYVYLAGVFSAYTLVLTKATAEIVSQSFSGDNQFNNGLSWLMVITFVAFNIFMEFWKQLALATFDALFVVPVAQVILVILSTLAGGVYFKELGALSLYQGLLFALGVLVICVGIYVLAQTEASETWKTILKVRKVMKLMKVVNAFKSARQRALKNKLLQAAKLTKAKEAGEDIGENPLADYKFPPEGDPSASANGGSVSTSDQLSEEAQLAAMRSAEADAMAIAAEQQAVLLAVAKNDSSMLLAGGVATSDATEAVNSGIARRLSRAQTTEVALLAALSQSDAVATASAAALAAAAAKQVGQPEPGPQLAQIVTQVAPENVRRASAIGATSPPAVMDRQASSPVISKSPGSWGASFFKQSPLGAVAAGDNFSPPQQQQQPPERTTSGALAASPSTRKPLAVATSVEVDETRSKRGFHIPTQRYNSILGGLWQYVKTRNDGSALPEMKARLHFREPVSNAAIEMKSPRQLQALGEAPAPSVDPVVESDLDGQPKVDVAIADTAEAGSKAVTSTMVQEFHISAQDAARSDKQVPQLGESIQRTVTVTDDSKAQRTVSVLVIHRPSIGAGNGAGSGRSGRDDDRKTP